MSNNLLFLIFSFSLFVLSTITICLAPIINGADKGVIFKDWNIQNCKLMEDIYQHDKDEKKYAVDLQDVKVEEKIEKRKISECKRHKVMHGLEYASLIVDVVLGFICFFLGIIHFLEPGNNFEKITGILGLLFGIIMAIVTIIYIGFSSYIFSNEVVKRDLKYHVLYENKALYKLISGDYYNDYDEKDYYEDTDVIYIKFKDLGKKQYNYDPELFQASTISDSYYSQCNADQNSDLSDLMANKACDYLWYTHNSMLKNDNNDNKYLYDRWLTTIIFGIIITICGIAMAIFGFLLFKNSNGSSDDKANLIKNN